MTDEPRDPGAAEAERSWKRKLEAGVETLLGDGRLKGIIPEMRLPREIVNHILGQVDETKQAAIKAIARETREFLERTDLADELARLLTQVSLQVELRFVPNEKAIRKARDEAAAASGKGAEAEGTGAGQALGPGEAGGKAGAGSGARSPRSGPPSKTARRKG